MYKNAYRYLLDADDLSLIVPFYLKKVEASKQIHIAQDNDISVIEIINMVEGALGEKLNYELIDKGARFNIDNKEFIEDRLAIYGMIHKHYYRDLIYKYTAIQRDVLSTSDNFVSTLR